MRDFTGEYESLLKGFNRFRAAAAALESPNAEDDDFVKTAIVGFSMNAPTETWSRHHFDVIKVAREEEFSDDHLAFLHGQQAKNYALFAALALGYLLGLRQSGQVNDSELAVAQAQLPGFMAGSVQALP